VKRVTRNGIAAQQIYFDACIVSYGSISFGLDPSTRASTPGPMIVKANEGRSQDLPVITPCYPVRKTHEPSGRF
jgi:hypothetical protein